MSFVNKHNAKENPFTFTTPESHEYMKPVDLVAQNGLDATYKLNAVYVNRKGKFGDEPVFITDNEIVNAPPHMMDTVRNILNDDESVKMIVDGKVFFKFYEYKNSKGNQVGISFLDA